MGDCAKVLHEFIASHADTIVANHKDMILFVRLDRDPEVADVNGGVGQ